MAILVNRFEIYLITLDPTLGREIKKTRPCLIISPNEMNHNISTIIVAPMTTKGTDYPTRINLRFLNKNAQIVLDQIRTIDKQRLVRRLGNIGTEARAKVINVLQEMFSF